ncbi:coenzyme F420-0:L-glutamate ligase [Patescibacteria group bacterium]|nr:coenzyme F420-0:L-glutamate ligase [Patescibacteria group bacterium]MBP9710277.1 coenzyme F420-0:L-glutamate ligase [Patescibacteria group bacterium]
MKVRAVQTGIFQAGQDLCAFIKEHVSALSEGDVLIVASKIVALSQCRVLSKVGTDKNFLIKQESSRQFPIEPGLVLTYKDGHWCPNAGIDESNVADGYVLWPLNPMEVAWNIWNWLCSTYSMHSCGIVITDSRVFPARQGVTAVALGYAGFKGLKDYRGQSDLVGRPMKYTVVNVADSLATAGAFLMGEGGESQPLAVIQEAPLEFVYEQGKEELVIDPAKDLFRILWA